MTRYPELNDVGPEGHTHFHRTKDTHTILSSSRIDVILATELGRKIIKPESAASHKVPYTTTHHCIHMELVPRAFHVNPTKNLVYKRQLPKSQDPEAKILQAALEERMERWPTPQETADEDTITTWDQRRSKITGEHATREDITYAGWAELWLETALRQGVRIRKAATTHHRREPALTDAGHVQAWGTHYGSRKQFWKTVREREEAGKGTVGLRVQDAEGNMLYAGHQVKQRIADFFQQRYIHPKESNPTWDRDWIAPGGPKDKIIRTIRTGPTVDPENFHQMREEDFERYCTFRLKRGKAGHGKGYAHFSRRRMETPDG
eukprot:gene58009-biopygen112848